MLSQNKLKVVGKVKVSGASSREERSAGAAGGGMEGAFVDHCGTSTLQPFSILTGAQDTRWTEGSV